VLLGDLCEEYRRGRSLLWYLAQVLAAILVASWNDARGRKGVALSAIALGFASKIAIGATLLIVRVTVHQHSRFVSEILIAADRYQLLGIAGDVVFGWWLVSLYRSYGMTMLVAFQAAMLGLLLIVFLWYASIYAIRMDSARLVWLVPRFRVAVASFFFESIVMLAGGYLATRRPESV